jgi:mannosyltransferase PIG-V
MPRWARAADFLSLLLLIVALVIAASGGVRARYGEWQIRITSPYRVLVWAALLIILRHWFYRAQPIYRQLPADIVRWVRSTPFRASLTTLVGTRLAIFFVGWMAVFVIGYAPEAKMKDLRSYDNELMNLPHRWDSNWYLGIAEKGYRYDATLGSQGQQNIVFFPAFPVTTRVVALLFGGSQGAYTLAGTLVALAAFLGALVYLFLLARDDLSDEQARTALWLLSAYPFAFFYGAIYTESFFLLGTTGAFYHLGRRQFVRAALWALLVGLTRPNGFLLAVPLAIVAASPWLPHDLLLGRKPEDRPAGESSQASIWGTAAAWVVVAMPIAGMLIYSAFIWSVAGTPFAWAQGHAAWGRHFTGLDKIVTDRYNYIASAGLYGYVRDLPTDVLNALGVIFVLVTVWPVWKRFGLAYAVFILINILPPLAEGGLLSAGRLTSVLFPAFLWLAAAAPERHRGGWIASFAANQALNASLFYTWRQLF